MNETRLVGLWGTPGIVPMSRTTHDSKYGYDTLPDVPLGRKRVKTKRPSIVQFSVRQLMVLVAIPPIAWCATGCDLPDGSQSDQGERLLGNGREGESERQATSQSPSLGRNCTSVSPSHVVSLDSGRRDEVGCARLTNGPSKRQGRGPKRLDTTRSLACNTASR